MNTECNRMTYLIICTFQNDVIGCFDRMIQIHTMLNNRNFGVPDQVCTLHTKSLKNRKYYIKTALGTAKTAYFSNNKCKLYGSGQGSGSSGTHWLFVSIYLMKTLEKSSNHQTKK